MLCPVVQGPGFPCACPGAYPGALFSVVVWTATRSAYSSSWPASRSANNGKRPVRPGTPLGHWVPNRKSKESDKDSQKEKQPHVCGF